MKFPSLARRFFVLALFTALPFLLYPAAASAFCGFYVAKADSQLWNEASQVVLVRDEDRTVITMVNDYKGAPRDFALVVPVPTSIKRKQINVGDMRVVDHLDAFSAPRLVEYHDPNPCERRPMALMSRSGVRARRSAAKPKSARPSAADLGVTIEASYTVGEYDILILSAKQSGGLATWLRYNDYRIPDGAERVLGSYLKQGMRFFVAKVNLDEQSKLGFNKLRPLQIAYESEKFMLPIRLGTVNARGKQDLIVYALTRQGRVESTNYRTVKLPTGMDIPEYVKGEFGDFYKAMFREQAKKDNRSVFLEYAWDMSWCDPCAANPLSSEELRKLGVFWAGQQPSRPTPNFRSRRRPMPMPKSGAQNVYLTRMHVRYDGETFPDDLMFQQTSDRSNFQGRYVMRHAAKGDLTCEAGQRYKEQLKERRRKEAQTLAQLTGWDLGAIERRMGLARKHSEQPVKETTWWDNLWR